MLAEYYRFKWPLLVVVIMTAFHTILPGQSKGLVKGNIADSLSKAPLEYASIAIYDNDSRTLINGAITDSQGHFTIEIPFGSYYAEASFLGFTTVTLSAFRLHADYPEKDFGNILLQAQSDVLNEVVVRAEKSTMELTLDKKIFNVGQDLANSGGSASDILMNIPSVAVDPEGNVRLRGSDNVRILIDGKPSGLVSFKGGSGLQQLPASMIERVEVVTNPSARYEAEGLGGVINIILKKETNQGFNGSFDVIVGHPDNYGLAANLNYRHKKVNFFINYGLAYRDQPGFSRLYQEVYGPTDTLLLQQSNTSSLSGLNNNIRGGIDIYFTEKSILTGSYLFRRSDAKRIMDIIYRDYLNTLASPLGYNTRRQDEDEVEPNSEYSLIYKRVFAGKGHELIAEAKFLDNWEYSDQTFTEYNFTPDGTENPDKAKLQKSINDEWEKQWLLQVDYVKPLSTEGKIEAGLRTSFRNMVNDFLVTQRNSTGEFEPLPGLDNIFHYDENIMAAYGIIGNKTGRVSYQAGLRSEWTDVKTTLKETNEVNPRKYYNLFPSAHITFNLRNEHNLQLSYSRRIRRPYYNDLSPYMTYSDERNFYSGNPDLEPEFSHVMEIGHVKYFEHGSLSSAVYARNTTDKIDNIRQVDPDGISLTRTENLRSESAYGLEIAGTFELTRWWKWDANLNFFYADIDGRNIQSTFRNTTYSWLARQTSRFSLPHGIDFQLRTNYEAPQKTVQGRRKALFFNDVSMSRDVLKGNGTVNLTVLDVFNSRKFRSVAEGETFYTDRTNQFRPRQINLTLSYRIKQSKEQRSKRDAVLTE